MSFYELRQRYGPAAFLVASVIVVGVFLYFSNAIVRDLATQERARMQIWADATKEIASLAEPENGGETGDIDFLLSIIEDNNNIPVILTTGSNDSIIGQRNYELPLPHDGFSAYTDENLEFLTEKLSHIKGSDNVIEIVISPGNVQHLYYEDSTLLRRLSLFPYIQLLVMAGFIIVVYFAVTSSKRAEQNKVWVGLSKETAHQLGTPISSLMAWMELMREQDVDPEMVNEMDKDVRRLSTIASRFSKIGSQPHIETSDLNTIIERAASYMRSRISPRIHLRVDACPGQLPVALSEPLIEWVMENLIKNAVDAMEGSGDITVTTMADRSKSRHPLAIVEVKDTGKGMTRKMRKAVFRPGFTTKKRGWGLGLTLARRIVEQYHNGRIYVSESEPGVGTTFRIEFPLSKQPDAS